jgi:hypothetical protein
MEKKKMLFAVSAFFLLGIPAVLAVTSLSFPIAWGSPVSANIEARWSDGSSSLKFGEYYAGATLSAQNYLTVCNRAPITYPVFIAGKDSYVSNGNCPVSNTMNIENIEYNWNGEWKDVPQRYTNMGCTDGVRCQIWTDSENNLIKNISAYECINITFRVNVPSPCTGRITTGGTVDILTQ